MPSAAPRWETARRRDIDHRSRRAKMANPQVRAPENADGVDWDLEADLVIVGGSIAGFTTALHAHELGASVIVLEKAPQVGGTARKAVAGMWVPNNRFMQEAGVVDRKEDALAYLARVWPDPSCSIRTIAR